MTSDHDAVADLEIKMPLDLMSAALIYAGWSRNLNRCNAYGGYCRPAPPMTRKRVTAGRLTGRSRSPSYVTILVLEDFVRCPAPRLLISSDDLPEAREPTADLTHRRYPLSNCFGPRSP